MCVIYLSNFSCILPQIWLHSGSMIHASTPRPQAVRAYIGTAHGTVTTASRGSVVPRPEAELALLWLGESRPALLLPDVTGQRRRHHRLWHQHLHAQARHPRCCAQEQREAICEGGSTVADLQQDGASVGFVRRDSWHNAPQTSELSGLRTATLVLLLMRPLVMAACASCLAVIASEVLCNTCTLSTLFRKHAACSVRTASPRLHCVDAPFCTWATGLTTV